MNKVRSQEQEKLSNDNNDAFSLPLLDEVNEIIYKEKVLLELKILEQENEAKVWKNRYESLLGSVSDTAAETGALEPLQFAANNASNTNNTNNTNDNNKVSIVSNNDNDPIDNIILSLSSNEWVIDLSYKTITSSILTRLCKGNSAITYTNPLLSVFNLSNSNIKEDSAQILSVLLSNPNVKAIDLSNNSLGILFTITTTTTNTTTRTITTTITTTTITTNTTTTTTTRDNI